MLLQQLAERAVEADRFLGVVLLRGAGEEETDQTEDDAASEADAADDGEDLLLPPAHLPELQVFLEPAREPAGDVDDARAEDREPGAADDSAAGEPLRGRVCATLAASCFASPTRGDNISDGSESHSRTGRAR
ncbi:MAG TPA: hypothetical protein VIZ29_03355 [Gaiellaceae bacterium]